MLKETATDTPCSACPDTDILEERLNAVAELKNDAVGIYSAL